jgi:hypothetical protein
MVIAASVISLSDWRAEATRLFIPSSFWRFRCPSCSSVFSVADLEAAGAKASLHAGQECIGRHRQGVGCIYAAYGLIPLPDLMTVQLGDSMILAFPCAPP